MRGRSPRMRIVTLKRRAEFLRVRGGGRCSTAMVVLVSRSRKLAAPETADEQLPRFGFTVTKKIGNAVVRNRIRRRFKEALRSLAPNTARSGYDYVLIARPGASMCDFEELRRDLVRAFAKLNSARERPPGDNPSRSRGHTQPERAEHSPNECTGARDA